MTLVAAGASIAAVGGATADEHEEDDDGEDEEDGNEDEEDGNEDEEDEDWFPPEASEAHAAVLSGHQADVETDASGCAHVTPLEEDALMVDLVIEDLECITQAHIHEGARDEDGPIVATLFEFTEEPDGTGDGDPLSTDPDTPLIQGTRVDDAELVSDLLADPDEYYVNVHTTHNPGGEIRGQLRGFERGQETDIEPEPAEFIVSHLDPWNGTVVQGDSLDVSARVRNVGDVTATQTVEFRIDGDVQAEQEVELACRESTTVTFDGVETGDLEPGTHEHGVFSDDDSMTGRLTVLEPPEFLVSALEPEEATIAQGDLIDVSATIENVGEATGTQTVEFRIDDELFDDHEQELELEGGELERVTFEDVDTGELELGEYEHGVFSEDDSETGTLTVQEPPEFTVSDLDPEEATVTQGDLIDVSATIENVSETTGTQTVEFRVDDELFGDHEQELELEGGESETVTFEDIDTGELEPDEYEHGVFSDDDEETGTLTIEEELEAAEFLVSDLDPEEATVTQGEPIDVSATVENVGEATTTQTVEFRVDDELFGDHEQELELEGGESETVSFEDVDTGELEPDEYEHGVFSEDDEETGTLTIEEVDPDDDPDDDVDDEPDDDVDDEPDDDPDDDVDDDVDDEPDDEPDDDVDDEPDDDIDDDPDDDVDDEPDDDIDDDPDDDIDDDVDDEPDDDPDDDIDDEPDDDPDDDVADDPGDDPDDDIDDTDDANNADDG